MINNYLPYSYKNSYMNTVKYSNKSPYLSINHQNHLDNKVSFGAYYDFTNRGFPFIKHFKVYPEKFLDPCRLKGLKIIDICTGGGQFIYDFIDEGKKLGIDIDILGLDRLINYKYLYHCPEYPKRIIKGDATRTQLPDKCFDVIYSLTGPLSYDGILFQKEQECVQLAVLTEMSRILKSGGCIRLGMCNLSHINRLIEDLPTLKVTDYNPIFNRDYMEKSWLEISKIN